MVLANIIPLCEEIFDTVITVSWHCYCSVTEKTNKKIILITVWNFAKLPNKKIPTEKTNKTPDHPPPQHLANEKTSAVLEFIVFADWYTQFVF